MPRQDRPAHSGERQRARRRRPGQGFTYLVLLFALAAIGLLLAGFGQSWRLSAQREREAELLAIGHEFSNALSSYRRMSAVGEPDRPQSLSELIEDHRFPMPVRHLRRLYRDPFSGEADWEVLRRDGRILAIHSSSELPALRRGRLPKWVSLADVEMRTPLYRHWLFMPAGSAPVVRGEPEPGSEPENPPDPP